MERVARERWELIYRADAPRVFRAPLATLRDRDAARDALHEAFLEGLERPPAGTITLGAGSSAARSASHDVARTGRFCLGSPTHSGPPVQTMSSCTCSIVSKQGGFFFS
jgi:hypothetical protein